jgi:hypothetical protein
MSNAMPVPAWAEDARKQMFEAHGKIDYQKAGAAPRELVALTGFSTHFAEKL